MARKRQDPTIRKNEFIEAAMKVFEAKGFENTSVRDILKQISVTTTISPSVFYYYFTSKDELLDACIHTYTDRYAQDMINILKDKTLDYNTVMKNAVTRIKKTLCYVQEINANGKTDNEYFHNLVAERLFDKIIPQLTTFISEGLTSGALPMTELARECGPKMIAKLICNGISTLFWGTGVQTEQHHFENACLIPVYVSHILGLRYSDFSQD